MWWPASFFVSRSSELHGVRAVFSRRRTGKEPIVQAFLDAEDKKVTRAFLMPGTKTVAWASAQATVFVLDVIRGRAVGRSQRALSCRGGTELVSVVPPPFGSASLPPSRSTLGGRGSRRAAGFNRHASSSAQQELRPPEGPRLPPNRGSERPCKQFGSAGASPSRRAQHPSQCHLHLHTGFRVDPFFRALRLCHATAGAADCNHASRES